MIWNALGGAVREIGPVDFYKATTAPMAPQTWRWKTYQKLGGKVIKIRIMAAQTAPNELHVSGRCFSVTRIIDRSYGGWTSQSSPRKRLCNRRLTPTSLRAMRIHKSLKKTFNGTGWRKCRAQLTKTTLAHHAPCQSPNDKQFAKRAHMYFFIFFSACFPDELAT